MENNETHYSVGYQYGLEDAKNNVHPHSGSEKAWREYSAGQSWEHDFEVEHEFYSGYLDGRKAAKLTD